MMLAAENRGVSGREQTLTLAHSYNLYVFIVHDITRLTINQRGRLFPPAFCASVRRIISTAPPPGTSVGLKTTFRGTDMASARLRSISSKMFLEGPRGRMAHALGVAHSVRKVKHLREIGSVEAC
jgi:hypothetical protein